MLLSVTSSVTMLTNLHRRRFMDSSLWILPAPGLLFCPLCIPPTLSKILRFCPLIGIIFSTILRMNTFLVTVSSLMWISMRKSLVAFLSILIIIFSNMVIVRPLDLPKSDVIANPLFLPLGYAPPVFVIHPPTSQLAEMLISDSEALNNENYSGIYDESGDYIPQYCDNPDLIPQGALEANRDTPPNGGTVGAAGASDEPAVTSSSSSDDALPA